MKVHAMGNAGYRCFWCDSGFTNWAGDQPHLPGCALVALLRKAGAL